MSKTAKYTCAEIKALLRQAGRPLRVLNICGIVNQVTAAADGLVRLERDGVKRWCHPKWIAHVIG